MNLILKDLMVDEWTVHETGWMQYPSREVLKAAEAVLVVLASCFAFGSKNHYERVCLVVFMEQVDIILVP